MYKPVRIKLYTVAVYKLILCMKEENIGPNYFNEDN